LLSLIGARVAQAAPIEQALTLDVGGGKALAGTLLLPAAAGKVPVVLLIAGSGPTDRDGNSGPGAQTDNLKMLARGLAAQGVASLRYDKRGIGASRAAMKFETTLRVDAYVDDAAAWIARLKADPRFSSVVVVGHSEGALVGLLAAQKSDAGADGFVSVAGIADNVGVVLRRQLASKLPPALLAESDRILGALEHGQTVADVPPALALLYRPSVQPFLISVMQYAPAERMARLRMPALIVQGATDLQLGIDQAEALKAADPQATLVLIPDMNHMLKNVPADAPDPTASYRDPTLPLHPRLAPAIADFVRGIKPAS
jgi:pimeloyl-ACP methyl ester carboxylesterase